MYKNGYKNMIVTTNLVAMSGSSLVVICREKEEYEKDIIRGNKLFLCSRVDKIQPILNSLINFFLANYIYDSLQASYILT